MPFQCQDLLHVVFLLPLVLGERKRGASNFLLSHLHLIIQLLVLTAQRLNSMLEPLDLHRGVSIVGKDVLFFNFESAGRLLGSSFLVHKFRVLSLQKLICVRTFAKFLVHKPILSR